jgi:5,10-methenyltetrahydrofolate synthetase
MRPDPSSPPQVYCRPFSRDITLSRSVEKWIHARTNQRCASKFATGRYLACQITNITEDLSHGQYGIREPGGHCIAIPSNRLDLILVPGVAFDAYGRRLGRGKGFYDQLLESVRGTTCGVAFDEQIVEAVPVEPHDVYLNCILTPTRWIEPGSARF